MLIKEYRIPLPLSVEEYKIAQLYMIAVSGSMTLPMPRSLTHSHFPTDTIPSCDLLLSIQKKSKEESQGTDSGVQILENEPYTEGPGGSGQYTYKIYHVGRHLPGRRLNSNCRFNEHFFISTFFFFDRSLAQAIIAKVSLDS